jgi:hypothetical protein
MIATITQWLSHTAGVRRGRGDRQSHRRENAHQQQNQKQPGGLPLHDADSYQPHVTY